MEVNIVIIDDSVMLQDDPLIWELKDKYGEANVNYFLTPNEGLTYIKQNLEKNMVVLLDIDFPPNEMNGHQILAEIADTSKLIPVILWSGIDENKEHFADFINNHAFGFFPKGVTIEEALPIIENAVTNLEMSVDNAIEDWIIRNDEDKDAVVFITSDGETFSLNQILSEIRKQTSVGKEFSQRLNKLTIDLLLRNKEQL